MDKLHYACSDPELHCTYPLCILINLLNESIADTGMYIFHQHNKYVLLVVT